MTLDTVDITGLVLAGGRGSRMGGVDKGLQLHLGMTLAQHALRRLDPQVGQLAINANRHREDYEAMGVPVWADSLPNFPGPMAGMLAGLQACGTPFLVTVPCDTPNFPLDLVARLAAGLAEADSDLAVAVTRSQGVLHRQPVFALMKKSLRDSAAEFLRGGHAKVGHWIGRQRFTEVVFEDDGAFRNANTLDDLRQWQPGPT